MYSHSLEPTKTPTALHFPVYLHRHHHQSATVVLKTRWPNIYCRDAHFCRQQEQMCGQRQSSYTPNSTAARRNWRRQPQSSCRLDSVLQRSRRRRTLNDTQWVIWMLNNIRAGQHFGNAQDNVYNTVPSTPFHLVQCSAGSWLRKCMCSE